MIRSSFSHFKLLKMIINEQHDLDKAKESVYILQRGLLLSHHFLFSRAHKHVLGITSRPRYRLFVIKHANKVNEIRNHCFFSNESFLDFSNLFTGTPIKKKMRSSV